MINRGYEQLLKTEGAEVRKK